MSGDPTALSKAIKTWACEEMLKRIVSILGLSDGDDPVEAVRQLKRRVAELEGKLESKELVVRTLSGANGEAMNILGPHVSNASGGIVEAAREASRKLFAAEAKDDILAGIYTDTEMHTAEVEPDRMVRDVVDQLVAAESRVRDLEKARLQQLKDARHDARHDALVEAVLRVARALETK